jgi:predicted Rossmann-fold nucleotide-binding protein
MHEYKALMSELSEDFVALPGGSGTLERFFEIRTWVQLGEREKPRGLLNLAGYYDPLLAFFDHMVAKGFYSELKRGAPGDGHRGERAGTVARRLRPLPTAKTPEWIGKAKT